MTTTRFQTIRAGSVIRTKRFRLRFDGVQGELFTQDSHQWTMLVPGHAADGVTIHMPAITTRKAVLKAANHQFDKLK